jgi:hypothetical protein
MASLSKLYFPTNSCLIVWPSPSQKAATESISKERRPRADSARCWQDARPTAGLYRTPCSTMSAKRRSMRSATDSAQIFNRK